MKKTEVDLEVQELTEEAFKNTEKYKYYLCCEIIKTGKQLVAELGHDITFVPKTN